MAAPANCAAMEDSGPQWFAAELEKVQATYQSGNAADAYPQLFDAKMSLPRSADVSLDARCAGPELWQRQYQLRQAITLSLGQQAEKAGKLANTQGALDWYVTGDNQADARRVIPKLTPTPKGTAFIINRLRNEIAMLEKATQAGFELLPEERAAQAFWQRGLDGTVVYARAKVAEVLEAETGLLTRAANDAELQNEQIQQGRQNMAADFFGDESLTVQNEMMRAANRANASIDMLTAAQDWALAVSTADATPVKDRAIARGDACMAQAGSATFSLEARDSLYQAAEDYFKFAGNFERLQTAERGRATLAPALKTERDQRAARIDKQADKMRQSAGQMKQDMEKTDA